MAKGRALHKHPRADTAEEAITGHWCDCTDGPHAVDPLAVETDPVHGADYATLVERGIIPRRAHEYDSDALAIREGWTQNDKEATR